MPSTATVTVLAETPAVASPAPAAQSAAILAGTPLPAAHRRNPATVTAQDPAVLAIFHHNRGQVAVVAYGFTRRLDPRHREDIRQVADCGLLQAAVSAVRSGRQPADVCDTYIRQCVAGRIRAYLQRSHTTYGDRRSGQRELEIGRLLGGKSESRIAQIKTRGLGILRAMCEV